MQVNEEFKICETKCRRFLPLYLEIEQFIKNVQENVERPDDLYEGPQSSWLGYLALAERVNIGDYKRYIEQVLVIRMPLIVALPPILTSLRIISS